jgi:hypothetical protein
MYFTDNQNANLCGYLMFFVCIIYKSCNFSKISEKFQDNHAKIISSNFRTRYLKQGCDL